MLQPDELSPQPQQRIINSNAKVELLNILPPTIKVVTPQYARNYLMVTDLYSNHQNWGMADMEEMLIDNPTLDLILDYLPNNADLADMASFFSVFGDVTRLKILSALAVDELCVSDIASIANINQTTVSHQLKLLRDSGMVSTRRNGKIIFYRIINPYVNNVMLMGVDYLIEIIKR